MLCELNMITGSISERGNQKETKNSVYNSKKNCTLCTHVNTGRNYTIFQGFYRDLS